MAPAPCSASAACRWRSRPASRTARASAWPARARPAARARRTAISMCMSRSGRTRFFQRDGANILMRVPLRMTPGGAGRRGRGAGDRRQPGQGEDPARHADRRSVPAARQGLLGAAQRRARRHVHPGRGRDAAEPDAPAARAAGGVRGRGREARQGQPGARGLLRQGEGVLRGRPRTTSVAPLRGSTPRSWEGWGGVQ